MTSVRGTELVYWVFALAGTFFFLFRIGAMVLGGLGSEDMHDGSGHDGVDAGAGGDHHPHSESDPAFKLVSIQSLTGFFMTFGWAGLSAQNQLGWSTLGSFVFAFLCGMAVMFATGYLLKMTRRLTSAGDVFRIEKTVGLKGATYLEVPAEGHGQVKLIVNNGTRYLDAVSEDKVEIKSFVDVVVVRVVDAQTVSVRPSH